MSILIQSVKDTIQTLKNKALAEQAKMDSEEKAMEFHERRLEAAGKERNELNLKIHALEAELKQIEHKTKR